MPIEPIDSTPNPVQKTQKATQPKQVSLDAKAKNEPNSAEKSVTGKKTQEKDSVKITGTFPEKTGNYSKPIGKRVDNAQAGRVLSAGGATSSFGVKGTKGASNAGKSIREVQKPRKSDRSTKTSGAGKPPQKSETSKNVASKMLDMLGI